MGSLRDQFKKANLLSAKDSKRLAHEERLARKEKGREGIEAEQAQRAVELARHREADRERDRERQAALDADRDAARERAACEAILESEARPPARGNAPWLFELPDGRMPLLRLGEADRHQLQSGVLCVVRTKPGDAHTYGLLATQHARRVQRQLPDRVVWAAPGTLSG